MNHRIIACTTSQIISSNVLLKHRGSYNKSSCPVQSSAYFLYAASTKNRRRHLRPSASSVRGDNDEDWERKVNTLNCTWPYTGLVEIGCSPRCKPLSFQLSYLWLRLLLCPQSSGRSPTIFFEDGARLIRLIACTNCLDLKGYPVGRAALVWTFEDFESRATNPCDDLQGAERTLSAIWWSQHLCFCLSGKSELAHFSWFWLMVQPRPE